MNKVLESIRKNLLILFRSKASSIAILLGPVFVILLIGFAFNAPESYDLSVGFTAPADDVMTARFVDNMHAQGFVVEQFSTIEECISRIQQAQIQTCIEFPQDFRIENNKTNELIFYVDESRTNFVYEIIDTVNKNVGAESSKISADLTNDILTLLWSTEMGIDDALALIITAKAKTGAGLDSSQIALDLASGMDLEYEKFGVSAVSDQFDEMSSVADGAISKGKEFVVSSDALVTALEGIGMGSNEDVIAFSEKLDTFSAYLGDKDDDYDSSAESITVVLDELKDHINTIAGQLEDADDDRSGIVSQIDDVRQQLNDVHTGLDDLKVHLETMKATIRTLKVTSSDTISSPIITTVKPVASQGNKLMYLYSYLLILVVLFICLLLPATLVVMEKSSRSAFRTFTTPTSDSVFMFAHFITSLIILLLQLGILLCLSYYFLGAALISNVWVSLSVLLLSMVMFIFLGMGIGYLFNTQQAVTTVSISLGSLFIFLSNLVLPIETFSEQLRTLIQYNPYVLTSETMRRALLFGTDFSGLSTELALIALYTLVVLVVIVVIKNVMKSQFYFHATFRHEIASPKDTYLHLGEDIIKDYPDLLEWLQKVDNKRFKEDFNWMIVRKWLSHDKSLRVRLAGKSRTKMIDILQKRVKSQQ